MILLVACKLVQHTSMSASFWPCLGVSGSPPRPPIVLGFSTSLSSLASSTSVLCVGVGTLPSESTRTPPPAPSEKLHGQTSHIGEYSTHNLDATGLSHWSAGWAVQSTQTTSTTRCSLSASGRVIVYGGRAYAEMRLILAKMIWSCDLEPDPRWRTWWIDIRFSRSGRSLSLLCRWGRS
jgi:hypothetical protein